LHGEIREVIYAVPKNPREHDPAYLAYVRGFNCVVGGCQSPSVPHHLQTVGSGGSDYSSVPICVPHHAEIHTIGQKRFEVIHDVNLWRESWLCLKKYIATEILK
jgi:hypothetical protein